MRSLAWTCSLSSLGHFDASDFWSFVRHCRGGAPDHGRPDGTYHDVVMGPLVGSCRWKQMMAMHDADQISFHTPRAEALLNRCLRRQVI